MLDIVMPILMTSKPIAAQEARRRFGELLDKAFYRRESFVVERAGEPKAVIVPVADYIDYQRRKQVAKKNFWAMTQELYKAFENKDPDEIEREIEVGIAEIRAKRRHR